MKITICETAEGLKKLSYYREIKRRDCSITLLTPLGKILLIFNSPEVKGLAGEVNYTFTPSVLGPIVTTPAKLLVDIEIPGRKAVKVYFHWNSGLPKALLETRFLVFLAAKRPKEMSDYFSPSDLFRFAKAGSLDVDLEIMRKNLEDVILPTELSNLLMSSIEAVH